LQDAFLSLLITGLTNIMGWFGTACIGLQRVSKSSGGNGLEFVALLLSRPCFHLSNLCFKLVYSINQVRLRQIGLYCASLGGHNLALEFDDLGRAFTLASEPGQSLNDVSRRIGARQARH
jgi:hypothetical protein